MVSNITNLWLDTTATWHICGNKSLFANLQVFNNGERVYPGNFANSKIECKGKVVLNVKFGQNLTLQNVLYTLDIRNNLLFGSMLISKGFRITFESNDFLIAKGAGLYLLKKAIWLMVYLSAMYYLLKILIK